MNKEERKENIIIAHHDADGITTAYFTSFKYPYRIEFCDTEFGDTTGLKKGDWMVDMRPREDNIEGLNVLDHHGPYPLAHKYNLIYDTVPASLIAWREFKEDIPKSEWWKIAIGLYGDGAPELIPYEVYKSCPQLIIKYESYMSNKKNYSTGNYPTYFSYPYLHLSSAINSFLRISNYDGALKCITESKQPFDIINSPEVASAKKIVNDEYLKILNNHKAYTFSDGRLGLITFNSNYRMSGYIASSLASSLDVNTLIAVNKKDGRGSLRGDLALYWKGKLEESGEFNYIEIDGHPGFMGFKCKKNVEVFIEDLSKIFNL